MKDLDKLFKDSLGGHEMPYDPSAWSALSSKMAPKAKPFYKKGWFYGTVAGVAAVTVGSVLLLNQNPKNDEQLVQNTPSHTEESFTKENHTSVSIKKQDVVSPVQIEDESFVIEDQKTKEKIEVKKSDFVEATPFEELNENQVDLPAPPEIPKASKGTYCPKIVSLNAEFNLLTETSCIGGSIFIHLPKQAEGVKETLFVNGKAYSISSRNVEIQATDLGKNELVYKVSKENTKSSEATKFFTVTDVPVAEFTYATVTEDGMPLTVFESDAKNAVWKIDGKIVSKDAEFKHLFMRRGTYNVSLESGNINGCSTTFEQDVFINKDYKLFAEDGLILSSSDPRLNTFMPFALKEMDNPEFMLTIMDARTGQTLFTTNDVNNAWDGTDLSGNKMPVNSNVVWKAFVKGNKYISGPIGGNITIQ